MLVARSLGDGDLGTGHVVLLVALGWLGLLAIFIVAIGRFAQPRGPGASVTPPILEGRITAATRLSELPALALDTETTGLDPVRDRIVSLGAVRLQGADLLRDQVIDVLINPGRKIPAVSTAVHGISDQMVEEAQAYAEVAPKIMAALEGVA